MRNTIPAAGEAMPKAARESDSIVGDLLDLEDDICCLASMAHITDHLLDHFILSEAHNQDRHRLVAFSPYEIDMLVFAWKNIASRTSDLRDKFYAAFKEEEK